VQQRLNRQAGGGCRARLASGERFAHVARFCTAFGTSDFCRGGGTSGCGRWKTKAAGVAPALPHLEIGAPSLFAVAGHSSRLLLQTLAPATPHKAKWSLQSPR